MSIAKSLIIIIFFHNFYLTLRWPLISPHSPQLLSTSVKHLKFEQELFYINFVGYIVLQNKYFYNDVSHIFPFGLDEKKIKHGLFKQKHYF